MKRIFAFVLLSFFLNGFAFTNTNCFQDEKYHHEEQRLVGYWEGDFMPGNDFTLILRFEILDEEIYGRVILFQGDFQIQDDPLNGIILSNDSLFFRIDVKGTSFSGSLGMDDQQISGKFLFPDRSLHEILVNKVILPSKGDFDKIEVYVTGEEILEKKYSTDQLKYDLNFLKSEIQSHPQLYLFTSKEEFEKEFEKAAHSIHSEMTEDEFFRIIAPITSKIRCSHTGIRFSDNYYRSLNELPYLIPLDIQFVDDEAFIINDFSENVEIENGTKVLSINGLPVAEIKEKLLAAVPTDGENPEAGLSEINANFAFAYSLYIGNDDTYILELLSPNGNSIMRNTDALNIQEYEEALMNAYPDDIPSGPIPVEMEIDKSRSTAILKVFAFWAPDPHLYIDFLAENFKKLKEENIKNLIIDVRGNQGGYPYYIAELLTYLIDKGFPYFILPSLKGEFEPLYDPIEVKEDAFSGNIYILIDGGCLSSTGHFLSLIKYHNLATLVGERSGASFYCNDNSKQVKLPETGINLNLAQTTFQTDVTGFEKGDALMPDHEVKNSLEDLLEGHDKAMEYIFIMIDKDQ